MDFEIKKWLSLLRNKGALANGVPTAETFDNTSDSLEATRDAIRVPGADAASNVNAADAIGDKTDTANTTVGATSSLMRYIKGILNRINGTPAFQEVVIYVAAATAGLGTTETTDDGTSPAYTTEVTTTNNAEGTPGALTFTINFEQEGTLSVQGIYFEGHWQSKYTLAAGNATASLSKWQISRDGGVTWVDITENFSQGTVAYVTRTRVGVGQWISTVVAGASQLQLRVAHWTNDTIGGGGRSSSEIQVRANSYIRLTYRKS